MKKILISGFSAFLLLSFWAVPSSGKAHLELETRFHNARTFVYAEDVKEVFKLVNELRAKGCSCGGQKMPVVPALAWNDALARAAQVHSEDMSKNDHFDHVGTDGSEHWDRMEAQGYDWNYTGENIAMGQQTPAEVMKSWIESSGHCKNMMSKDYIHIGVGRAGNYWTQVFGRGQ